ncbi:endonuclease/exonuclease/phosphatase family protein [Compostibacter hankyongensis]|uniref:Endonuclease/exonuclease/phosphatase family protein n=1 Tax=Compostibacter hankyongensis TaxID=1007089 RepID=A0ABP8FWZ8_9BACT
MIRKIAFMAALLLCLCVYVRGQELTVATYNMRNDNNKEDAQHGDGWKQRCPVIAALIRFHDFDIFGTQECLYHQLQDLSGKLPGYAWTGVGRDDGRQAGEHSAIFYKTSRFKLLDKGDFWLSQTPEKPSLGWDAKCCFRICSWARLEDRQSHKQFYCFNLHYDHQGVQARIESSKLVLKKIREIAGNHPVILTGDFNGGHDTEWYKAIAASGVLKDVYTLAKDPYINNGSFNAFGRALDHMTIIDHIFITPDFTVDKYGILTDTYHGRYPSDHFPVMVQLKL